MVSNYPPEKVAPAAEVVAEQSRRAQAQAGNDSQDPRTEPLVFDDNILLTADGNGDDEPPPAYGEIHSNQEGFNTSARVTDDGRVNIQINQLNRRLSQIFTPALREHIQSAKDDQPPPPLPYIPPSLGGEEGVPPPPSLNVVIQVVGSRGDVQPFVALGKVLKETYGHRVRLATHPIFKDFVLEHGLEFFSIGGDPSRLMAFMVKNPSLMPGFRSLMSGDISQRRRDVAEFIQGCWRSCYQAGDGLNVAASVDDLSEHTAVPFIADCIIANPPSFAHIHCAEKLGVPLHIMFTMPYSPTQAFPHPLTNIQSSNADPQLTNYLSYSMIEVLSWQGLGDIINRFRIKCLGLDPVSLIWAPGMIQRLKVPHTYCWSPALVPKPKDWGSHISISGFFFLNSAPDYSPPPELKEFLSNGPTPIYIGFGSIVLDDPNAMTKLIFEAAVRTGQRVLLSKGWGGMGADELQIPENIFLLGNVPHDWLFNHVSCVVHHGGAGTTAAGISAGRPTVVVPFFGDQPFWGSMVARAGAGPDPIPHKQLNARNLADAIKFCLEPQSLERAKELADRIAAERGSDTGAQSFHQYLEPDRLRCLFSPSRAAAWRIRRTKIGLSPFAACTLANANLLKFSDLKLFRAQEWETEEGPWDPITGGFVAACGAFGDMAKGLGDVPTETFKALHMSIKASRKKAKAKKRDVLEGESGPSDSNLSEHEQKLTNLESHTSNRPSSSVASTSTSNIGSSFVSDTLQSQSSFKTDETNLDALSGRRVPVPAENPDLLIRRGPQMSKGIGRFTKALVESPMEVSMSLTKGCRNLPKLWGDDTVRPQTQVSDFKSGAKVAGKEFGLGWYDGLTGLVTQPYTGAQKEGASGFFKGVGKGMGGFFSKASAGSLGLVGYTLKGFQKEMQKQFGNNVQHYIIASRAAQGYEEWLQSSDTEKQNIIDRWKLVQKYLKKSRKHDELVRDVLEAHQKMNKKDSDNILHRQSFASTAHVSATDAANINPQISMVANNEFQASRGLTEASRSNAAEDVAGMEQSVEHMETGSIQHQNSHTDTNEDEESLRQAMAASEVEARQRALETTEYEQMLNRIMAQSLEEHGPKLSDSDDESSLVLNDEDEEEFERTFRNSGDMLEKSASTSKDSPSTQRLPSYDRGHLAGTTQSQFEAQQLAQQREKTLEEKTEEEIVLAYIKKQSLLEEQHRIRDKRPATTIVDDNDDEDLQRALKLSMLEQHHGTEHLGGEASGM